MSSTISTPLSYTLGLDIGNASVGAALLGPDRILGLHVRTFDRAETAKEGESLNKIRREARLTRRRLQRRAHRLLRLRRLFKRQGLVPIAETSAFAGTRSPWELRAEGLHRLLEPTEWAAVLYHLVKHRGFQSNRKSEAKTDEKAGQMLSSISENRRKLKDSGFLTIGELVVNHPDFTRAKRNKGGDYTHTLARSEVENELQTLFERQRTKFANPHTSRELEEAVHTLGRSDQLMHTAMQSFNSSGPSPFSLIFGSCRSPFLHQAGHSGPMALNQAHYACKSNLFRARSDFFAMTRFTSAQDTNK